MALPALRTGMARFEIGAQHHAFLFVRVGACQNRNCFGIVWVERQVRNAGWNIQKIAFTHNHMLFEFFAIPHVHHAAQHVDRRFVVFVQMRVGARAGRA